MKIEINFDERKIIQQCIAEKISSNKMAEILSRSRTGIDKEIKRNGGRKNYSADRAQKEADIRREGKFIKRRKGLTEEQESILEKCIAQEYSINKISKLMNIWPSTIKSILTKRNIKIKYQRYTDFADRIQALEYQIEIILEILEELSKK